MKNFALVILAILTLTAVTFAQSGRRKTAPASPSTPIADSSAPTSGGDAQRPVGDWSEYSESAANSARTVWAKAGESRKKDKPAAKPAATPAATTAPADGDEVLKVDTAIVTVPVSVYDRNGLNIFSFNDRTTVDGRVNFVVLTPVQTIEVRKQLPEEFINSVFVEADIDQGIVVVRAFVPDQTWRSAVADFLGSIACVSR